VTGIADDYIDTIAIEPGADMHNLIRFTVSLGCIHRIHDEVQDDLLHGYRICIDCRQRVRQHRPDCHAAPHGIGLNQVQDAVCNFIQVERSTLQSALSHQRTQPLNHLRRRQALIFDIDECIVKLCHHGFIIEVLCVHEAGARIGNDRCEWLLQLVHDRGHQLAGQGKPARVCKIEPDGCQFVFGTLQFGYVPAGAQHRPAMDRDSLQMSEDGAVLAGLCDDLPLDIPEFALRSSRPDQTDSARAIAQCAPLPGLHPAHSRRSHRRLGRCT
jgi:hypothetical protein